MAHSNPVIHTQISNGQANLTEKKVKALLLIFNITCSDCGNCEKY